MSTNIQTILQDPISILQIASTIIGAFLIVSIFNLLIGRLERRGELQKGTLVHLKRFFQIVIYLIAGTIVLSILSVDITGMIAGLGVGALVIGFGLQDIIENWVSGVLIISGKTYTIGDVIRIGDLIGTVTDITLRTTKLKTYDRNEIIIPNSVLMKEKIINLTGGKQEAVSSLTFTIDYTEDPNKTKDIIESILKKHKSVIFDPKKKREIRIIFRNKEWTNELEALFWIKDPSNEEFIKSNITEQIQNLFKRQGILPPIPPLLRREYLTSKTENNEQKTI